MPAPNWRTQRDPKVHRELDNWWNAIALADEVANAEQQRALEAADANVGTSKVCRPENLDKSEQIELFFVIQDFLSNKEKNTVYLKGNPYY